MDAYFHLLFHPRDRKYLRFVWRNHIFQFRALPFGLAPAPWVFTKVARELCLHVRERGIRLKAYLDDGLLLASSRTLCTQQALQVLSLCRDLGFVLNEEKSDLVPAQQFQFLRRKLVLINTDNTTVACYVNKQGGGGGTLPLAVSESGTASPLVRGGEHSPIRETCSGENKHPDGLYRPVPHVSSLGMDSGPLSARTSLGGWFKPQVDLFATRFNHRLPLYVSPVLDPTAWAIDALSIPWSNLLGYAFPPFPILGKVLRKAREDLATLILVAPRWPAQAWFPELLHLSHVPPVKLSVSARSPLQPSGLPGDVAFDPEGSMSLRFLSEFLDKNQVPGAPSPSISIHPLTSILAPDDEDRTLCPVRSLRIYRKRTRSFRQKQRHLFLSYNEGYKTDIRRSSLSRWLKEVIKAAYARPNEELAVFSPRPHDIRAWASSLAFSHSVSLQKVLDAVYWRSPGTFIQYYLRGVSRLHDDGSRGIASAVVAQHPISATRPVSSRSSSR
ncbi:hypothetical protein ACOMHN_043595 [Nucella lapillus]